MASVHTHIELGRVRLADGDYAGALTAADAALSLDPASFEALQLRSRALYLLGREPEALQTLRQVHAVLHQFMEPATPDDEDDLPFLDEDEDEDEQEPFTGADALETLLALREHYTLDTALLTLLAELAADAGCYEIATGAYQELIAADPAQLNAWEGLVHVLSHEDLDEALRTLDIALARFPHHPLFYEFLGSIRFHRRRFRDALDAYQQAIVEGANHVDNQQMVIECDLMLRRDDEALETLQAVLMQYPTHVPLRRFAIEVAIETEHPALAIPSAHELVRLQPSHAETYCWKARAELACDDWPAAERSLRLGFHKAVDGAFALFELAVLLIDADELGDALRVAELAATLAPDHPETPATRGKVLREMGELPEALAAFREAAVLAPQDDTYQTWIGIVLSDLGETLEAVRQFSHVLARHPSDIWTLYYRGMAYLALHQPEKALADFARGLAIDPQYASLYIGQACARAMRGDADAAVADLARAVDLSDEVHEWLADEPLLRPLYGHPGFQEIMHRLFEEE